MLRPFGSRVGPPVDGVAACVPVLFLAAAGILVLALVVPLQRPQRQRDDSRDDNKNGEIIEL